MTKRFDLLSMGRVAVDLYANDIHTPLKDVHSFSKYLGGSPGNIAFGASRLGLKSALFSKVGDDAMGDFLLETLARANVDTSLVSKTKEHLTALVVLGVNPPDDFPLIFYRQSCADMALTLDDINESLVGNSRYVQFSGTGISTESMQQVTEKTLMLAKAKGAKIILDVDYRPVLWGQANLADGETRFVSSQHVSEVYQRFLPFCDLIVGTDEELMIASGQDDSQSALAFLKKHHQADIVYKKGLQGSEVHCYQGGDVIAVDAFKVDVFNTLGAGDAYLSALIYGLVQDKGWQQALAYANASGAIVSSRHGCAPAMPTVDELNYFIEHYHTEGPAIVSSAPLQQDNPALKSSPLIKTPQGFPMGETSLVTMDDAYQTGMNFKVIKLNQGERYELTAPLENAALLMTGAVSFQWGDNSQEVKRRSYFDEDPFVLHTPRDLKSAVVALTDCEILLMQTENDVIFSPTLFDSETMFESERRGRGLLDDASYRIVRTVFDKRNRPESNLVVGEIITFQGHWSSCPPHYHPQPEIYHYRFSEPQGFAFAEDGDDALKVYHNDTLVILDNKTHAHATAPGYALYTLWFIRHLKDNPYIMPDFKKEHDWTRFDTANQRVWQPREDN